MKDPLVSICIPTYNRPELLKELLDSIFCQKFTNFEVIITDNSSNEKTKDLITSVFGNKNIIYHKNHINLGMGGNTIKALGCVRGKYFTFTADDDIWIDKEKLKKQVNFLEQNPQINIVYTNASSISYNGTELTKFDSVYKEEKGITEIIQSSNLLPGNENRYFLNILTPLLRSQTMLKVFSQSWHFESEEFFCYYLAAINQPIGFLYDKTVSLREAEHYRTIFENGKIVDWKKRNDLRIIQIFSIINTLKFLHPETRALLSQSECEKYLARYIFKKARDSKSLKLLLSSALSCLLFFKSVTLIDILFGKNTSPKKTFGSANVK